MKKKTHNHKIRSYKRKIRNQEQRYEFLKNHCKKVINDRDIAISKYESLLRRIRTIKFAFAVRDSDLLYVRNGNINIEEKIIRSFLQDLVKNEDFIRSIKVESRDEFDVCRRMYECRINILTD